MNGNEFLSGRTALVTGGSRGIGAAIVRRLAEAGADVAFTYNTGVDEAANVARDVRGLGRAATPIAADLGSADSAAQVVQTAVESLGKLDILVNNAGVTAWGPLTDVTIEDFDRLLAVNARAPLMLIAAAANALADGGRIINISSAVTSTALAGGALYSGSKAFIDQITKIAAIELAPRRVTVNAVAPGTTATGRLANPTPEQRIQMGEAFTLGRVGEPADTAALVAFLTSEEAGFITGQVIYNNGGQVRPVGRAT